MHLFLRELGKHSNSMEVITNKKEDYISYSIKVLLNNYIDKNSEENEKLIELRFTDSFKFMSSSLDSLTKNFVSGGGKWLFEFEDYSELQYDLFTRKGIHPYQYMSSWDRFEETQLPLIEAFHSKLNMSSISSNDYQHAQRVWKEFRIHNQEIITIYISEPMWSYSQTCTKLLGKCAWSTRSSAFLYISKVGLESVSEAHRN